MTFGKTFLGLMIVLVPASIYLGNLKINANRKYGAEIRAQIKKEGAIKLIKDGRLEGRVVDSVSADSYDGRDSVYQTVVQTKYGTFYLKFEGEEAVKVKLANPNASQDKDKIFVYPQ